MRSNLIIIAAMIAGIAVAWFAFAPAPEALPDMPSPAALTAEATRPTPPPGPTKGPNPVNEAFQQRLNKPDAALAGMQGSVWSVVRREIGQQGRVEGDALLAEANDLVRDLRDARLRADSADFDDLKRRQDSLRAKIKAEGLTTPVVDAQFKRLDDLAAAYASGGSLTAPMQPTAAERGAPSSSQSNLPGGGPQLSAEGGNGGVPSGEPFVERWEPVLEQAEVVDPSSPLGIPWADEDNPFGDLR